MTIMCILRVLGPGWELMISLVSDYYMYFNSTGIEMRTQDKFKDCRWNLLFLNIAIGEYWYCDVSLQDFVSPRYYNEWLIKYFGEGDVETNPTIFLLKGTLPATQ